MALAESITCSHYNGTEVSTRANSIKNKDTSLSTFVRCDGSTRVMESEWRSMSTSSRKQQILYIHIYIGCTYGSDTSPPKIQCTYATLTALYPDFFTSSCRVIHFNIILPPIIWFLRSDTLNIYSRL